MIIYSNSENTVALFNLLQAPHTCLNCMLKFSVDLLIQENIQLCVLHIAGEDNHVADALSHCQFNCAWKYNPSIFIDSFQPPHPVLGH
ncbi:hypothetical protein BDQ17DRAFT_1233545 [Cyathus striatus]|nr:hypothetical protein BDQ17DRAFT_1233545 [Cyathus striatus]